jgi:diaminohydroxyphosphoribosylaminopyrimidine deaminase/5-amino-6-(5-phosphoribosylamino)uracil reductase
MRLFSDEVAGIGDPHLRHAAELALRGRGLTAPNPWVGCVIVAPDGTVVGEGFHERAGEPHAEANALAQAGDLARGATVYVTLEPCAHTGNTPPCAQSLAQAGVAEVVIGIPDPNPLARGGADYLRYAGVGVRFADGADAAALSLLLEEWLHSVTSGRPWVTVKVGLSLDGKASMSAGVRTSMTGMDGALVTMALRAAHDAVLVGATTVAADNPSLTRRYPDHTPYERQPLRVVLAGESTPDPRSRMFTDGRGPTAVLLPDSATAERMKTMRDAGAEVALYSATRGVAAAMEALAALGVVSVLAETGPRTFTTFWDADLVDALVTVTAGGMAGPQGPSLYRGETESYEVTELPRRMIAIEAGVTGEVAAVQWRRRRPEVT